jgi:hypothetical protein
MTYTPCVSACDEVLVSHATFDPIATTYDDDFTRTPIARLMRQAVWARMDKHGCAGRFDEYLR